MRNFRFLLKLFWNQHIRCPFIPHTFRNKQHIWATSVAQSVGNSLPTDDITHLFVNSEIQMQNPAFRKITIWICNTLWDNFGSTTKRLEDTFLYEIFGWKIQYRYIIPLSHVTFLWEDISTRVKMMNRIPPINLTYSSFNHLKTPKQEKGHYQKHGVVFLSDQWTVLLWFTLRTVTQLKESVTLKIWLAMCLSFQQMTSFLLHIKEAV